MLQTNNVFETALRTFPIPVTTGLTARDLRELCHLWRLIEGAALREAARPLTGSVAECADRTGSPVGRHQAFHVAIARGSGNAHYAVVLGDILDDLSPYLAVAEQADPGCLRRVEAALVGSSPESVVETLGGHVDRLQDCVELALRQAATA
jgi:DNA-binding GntR family transcriptional regulator